MEDFMENIAPKIWPVGNRTGKFKINIHLNSSKHSNNIKIKLSLHQHFATWPEE